MIQQEGMVKCVNIHEDICQSPTHFNNFLTNAFFITNNSSYVYRINSLTSSNLSSVKNDNNITIKSLPISMLL